VIRTRRVYEAPADDDGFRVLVDRLWPRGVSREDAALDRWMKEIAPSDELRTWFGHDPERWDGFRARYARELDEKAEEVDFLREKAGEGTLTLVYAARDTEHNNAVALAAYLTGDRGQGESRDA